MMDPKKYEIVTPDSFKLDRIRGAVESLGHPELGRKTILVAGTNGKGSTCVYLSNLLKLSGLKVGTYTSPHLLHRTERIRVNLEEVTEDYLVDLEKRYSVQLEPLTYFERLTVLAFLAFKEHEVDVQVLEVGMGGRLDATNITEPDASVICSLGYDHQDVLGESLEEIAHEKAGIMRTARPVFVGAQSEAAAIRYLEKEARHYDAIIYQASAELRDREVEKTIWELWPEEKNIQRANARLAYHVYDFLARQWGFAKTSEIEVAFEPQNIQGRCQVLRKAPLWIVDGAHNTHASEALAAFIRSKYQDQKFKCYFGALQDKKPIEVFKPVLPFVYEINLPEFYEPRQIPPPELREELIRNLKLHAGNIKTLQEPQSWIEAAWSSGENVLVFGSFYLVGEVLASLKQMGVEYGG